MALCLLSAACFTESPVTQNTAQGTGEPDSTDDTAAPDAGTSTGFSATAGDPDSSSTTHDTVDPQGTSTGDPDRGCALESCDDAARFCAAAPQQCDAALACTGCPRSTHFAPYRTVWRVPEGGEPLGGFRSDVHPTRWATFDLNGDNALDLVLFGEANPEEPAQLRVFGLDQGQPHWRVHLGVQGGFASEAEPWPIPPGGKPGAGFIAAAGTLPDADAPSSVPTTRSETMAEERQAWELRDLDGDGRLDLVVTAHIVPDSDEGPHAAPRVFGAGTAPHWRVFLNTGDSFAAAPVPWSVPPTPGQPRTFTALDGVPVGFTTETVGAHAWETEDLDGDGLPELIVTATAVERPGFFWWPEVLGYPDTPHWEVYENNGAGFAASASTWDVPQGGTESAGFWAFEGEPGDQNEAALGAHAWSVKDLNGDGRLDVVVTAEAVPRPGEIWSPRVFSHDTAPRWNVYLGIEGGFAARPVPWALPLGGEYWSGFASLNGVPGPDYAVEAVGGEHWSLEDINGDRAVDLVVTGIAVERPGYAWWSRVFGHNQRTPQWRVYENVGSGFAELPTTWSLPLAGEAFGGLFTFRGGPGVEAYATIGGHHWTTADIDGDDRLDIAVMSEARPREAFFWWLEVLGYGSDVPHWDVYLGTP